MSEHLILKDTKLVNRTQYPGEGGVSQVLRIRALLNRPLAEQLKCYDNCFAENGLPRQFVDLKLTGLVIEGCEVVLDAATTLLAHKVSNFAVGRPKEKSETDASLEVHCNLHFAGDLPLDDWFIARNRQQFDVTMNPPPTWNPQ